MKAPKSERGADRAFEDARAAARRRSPRRRGPRIDRVAPGRRQVHPWRPACGASGRGPSPPRGCADGRAAVGVDPPALGAAVLAAALLLRLSHVALSRRDMRSNQASASASRASIVCRCGSKPRIGTSARVARERRRGDQADQLGLQRPGAERRRQLPHPLDDLAERDRKRVVDVGRDLGAAAGEQQADRAHAGQAAARLAQARRRPPGRPRRRRCRARR